MAETRTGPVPSSGQEVSLIGRPLLPRLLLSPCPSPGAWTFPVAPTHVSRAGALTSGRSPPPLSSCRRARECASPQRGKGHSHVRRWIEKGLLSLT